MPRPVKRTIKVAVIVCLLGVGFSNADVKLRIYMQDGTLRAGNLVTENDQSFVILTKAGREELPKDKIMFVNGKTLQQWQARPDKLFQTEILPEVPNPSYVNDKASLPPPVAEPAKPGKTPTPTKNKSTEKSVEPVEVKKPVPPPTAATVPAVKPVPVVETKKSAEEKPAAKVEPKQESPAPAAVPIQKLSRKRHRPAIENKEPEEIKPSVKTEMKNSPIVASSLIQKPRRFDRQSYADYHHQRAVAMVKEGQNGLAIQELHIATMLNKVDEEGIVMLGKLYREQGSPARALKILKSPVLKKNKEALNQADQIEQLLNQEQKSKKVFYAEAAAGILLTFPLLGLARKLKRKEKEPVVMTADDLDATLDVKEEKKELPVLSDEFKKAFEEVVEEVHSFEKIEKPKPIVPEMPPLMAMKNPAVPINVEATKEREEILEAISLAKKITPPPPLQKTPSEIPAERKEGQPEPIVPEVIEPVLPVVEREEFLKISRVVAVAVQRGNELAFENKLVEAAREYRTVLALQPEAIDGHLGMGFVCFMQNQLDTAMEYYVKALKINSQSADAHYGAGRVFLEMGREEEAVQEFQTSLALDPSFADARDTLTALGQAA